MIASSLTWRRILLTMAAPCAIATECADCVAHSEEPLMMMQLQASEGEIAGQNASVQTSGCPTYSHTAEGKCCDRSYCTRRDGTKVQEKPSMCCVKVVWGGGMGCEEYNHCAPDSQTSMGWNCRGECGNHGYPYRWCRTTNDKWDYCVPESIKADREILERARENEGGVDRCIKWNEYGWYDGQYEFALPASESPDGSAWSWQTCAARCANEPACEFWTLQDKGDKMCLLMSNKGDYHNECCHTSGPRKTLCMA